MNDPHIETLIYRFISDNPNDLFEKDSPLTAVLGVFKVELHDDILKVWPQEHFAEEWSARNAFEPYLQDWEAKSLLSESRFRIRFDFIQSQIIDRKPDTKGITVRARTAAMVLVTDKVTVQRISQYPTPDPEISFRPSDLTDQLIFRYNRYLDGRELLTTLANWVETRLRKEYGNRSDVAKALNIDEEILSIIGKLCDTEDPIYGRKAKGWGPKQLKSEHQQWLNEAIRCLILRVGEVNAGVIQLPTIMLKNLPKLDN